MNKQGTTFASTECDPAYRKIALHKTLNCKQVNDLLTVLAAFYMVHHVNVVRSDSTTDNHQTGVIHGMVFLAQTCLV